MMSFDEQHCLTSQTRPQPAQASNEIINGDSRDQNSQPAITNCEHGKKGTHCGTLKMSKAPRNLGSACQIFFWPKSLLMGIYMWEKVEKVFPFNVPGLQDP